MNKKQIIDILNIGENREVEFKESKQKLPKSLWETYSSFANTRGGFIILGIKEDKENKICSLEGIENTNNILKDFWNTINNKEKVSSNILDDDDINVADIENKRIIIISVPRANRRNKPIYINNNPITGTYKRFHEGDFRCAEHEVKAMITESNEKTKDQIKLEEYNINNINKETLNDYRIRFKIHKGESHEWNKLNDEDFLYMLNALDRKTKSLTLAGLLMFGKEKDIVEILPNYFLDYREVKDNANTERWSNRITSWNDNWTGNLWDFFEKIVNKLTSDIEVPFELDKDLMRIDDTVVHKCIREALSNCLIHAQFDESGSIVVEKRQNYFKFANPGNMRVPIDEAFKGGQSDPRNPLLHKMFSYLGYGERAGSGLSMINDIWKEKGWIVPRIEETFHPNRTTLILYTKEDSNNYTNNYTKNYTNNYPNKINNTQLKIIEIIKGNPTITAKELTESIPNITLAGVKWNLKKMKDNGIIIREGTARKGKWIIL